MMLSRSTSPTPPASMKKGDTESSVTLSKDALYAPLSTYADCSQKHDATAASPASKASSKTKSSHSLTLQTKSTLTSLITSLTSMSQNLKTSHPQEYQLYRGIGDSMSRFGMGDSDRANKSMRSLLEEKLSNRSLILIGGGIHSQTPSTVDEGGAIGLGVIAAVASSGGKRERKRVGGNGIFGCISNKKRKRKMMQILEPETRERGDVEVSAQVEKTKEKEKPHDVSLTNKKEQIGEIIETIHGMWIKYMHQSFSPIRESLKDSSQSMATLTLYHKQQISTLLATAEHVGMPATIVECPSRRHLILSRCIVVNETMETWEVATIMKKNNKGDKPKVKDVEAKATKLPSYPWKVVMVPKRGTVLEIDLPWGAFFDSKDRLPESEPTEKACVTVRLET